MSHQVTIDGTTIGTQHLRLRPWRPEDAVGALAIYGAADVARWLAPAMARVDEPEEMRALIGRWVAETGTGRPTGRWAIDDLDSGTLIGSGQILGLPPEGEDLELGYQLAPTAWGRGLGAEAGHALAHYAFSHDEEEVFAVVRPGNQHGIRTARAIGMEWVGETTKYYELKLQVFRLRKGDLDAAARCAP